MIKDNNVSGNDIKSKFQPLIKTLLLKLVYIAVMLNSVTGYSLAQSNSNDTRQYRFVCDKSPQGTWTTFAVSSSGEKRALIKWRADDFTLAGYPPKLRCMQVTGRLSKFSNDGFNYISPGQMNGVPVVCISRSKEGLCSGMLFTLKPGQNAEATIKELFDLHATNFSGNPVIESSCRTVVNLQALLRGQEKIAQKICF